MNLSQLLVTLFEGIDFEPSMNVETLYDRVGVGQSVLTEDMIAVHFPANGETAKLSEWPFAEGITLINSHSGVVEVLNDGELARVAGYMPEQTVIEILVEFVKYLVKERDAVDPERARKQFHELWNNHVCRILPDPADIRKALNEQNEQNRTNTESMGPC